MDPITKAVARKKKAARAARAEELRRHLDLPDAQAIRNVLATPGGRALVKFLKVLFDGEDIEGEDVLETYANIGARRVVKELERAATSNETGEPHA